MIKSIHEQHLTPCWVILPPQRKEVKPCVVFELGVLMQQMKEQGLEDRIQTRVLRTPKPVLSLMPQLHCKS